MGKGPSLVKGPRHHSPGTSRRPGRTALGTLLAAAVAFGALAACQGEDRAAHEREVLFSQGGLLGPELEVVAGRDRVFGAKVALEVGRRPMVPVWLPLDEAEAWAGEVEALARDVHPDEGRDGPRTAPTSGELGEGRAVLELADGDDGKGFRLEAFQRDGGARAHVELGPGDREAMVRAVREAVARLRHPD